MFRLTEKFLSTPSARRATRLHNKSVCFGVISIHALREEGDQVDALGFSCSHVISIHALREEGDVLSKRLLICRSNFYPRPPRGGRRAGITSHKQGILISIHALREEGDHQCGGRQNQSGAFLSTPSARRATGQCRPCRLSRLYFYPRPPRGGRPLCSVYLFKESYFYPRPPRGGRPTNGSTPSIPCWYFYPRPPRGGRLLR